MWVPNNELFWLQIYQHNARTQEDFLENKSLERQKSTRKDDLQHVPSYHEVNLVPLLRICKTLTALAASICSGKILIEALEANSCQTVIVITYVPAPVFMSSRNLIGCASVEKVNNMFPSGQYGPPFCKKTAFWRKILWMKYLCIAAMASLFNIRPTLKNSKLTSPYTCNFCLSRHHVKKCWWCKWILNSKSWCGKRCSSSRLWHRYGHWKWWLVPLGKILCNLLLKNFVTESCDQSLKSINVVAGVNPSFLFSLVVLVMKPGSYDFRV